MQFLYSRTSYNATIDCDKEYLVLFVKLILKLMFPRMVFEETVLDFREYNCLDG